MQRPKIDDKLRLLTDFGETEAICTEVLDNPTGEGGTLLKVMARGPFQEPAVLDRRSRRIENRRGGRERLQTNNRQRSHAFYRAPGVIVSFLVCSCSRPPLSLRPARCQTLTDNRCNFAQRFPNEQG